MIPTEKELMDLSGVGRATPASHALDITETIAALYEAAREGRTVVL
jgi:hypothetical protein